MLNKTYLPILLSGILLVVFLLLGWQLFTQAPEWHYKEHLTVQPIPGKIWKLGFAELGQHETANAADHQHVQLEYDPTPMGKDNPTPKGWMLSNLSASKGLLYKYNTDEPDADHHRLRQWLLAQGDEIRLDQVTLTVQALEKGTVLLENKTKPQQAQWRSGWFGGALTANDAANFAGCDDDINGFYLGGDVPCSTRWRVLAEDDETTLPKKETTLPTKAASIVQVGEGFLLRPHDTEAAFQVVRAGSAVDLMKMAVPVVENARNITEIIVGKTAYRVAVNGKAELTLRASGDNIHLFSYPAGTNVPGGFIQWQPAPVDWWPGKAWALGLGLMALLSAIAALAVAVAQQESREPARFWRNLMLLLMPLIGLWLGLVWGKHLAVLAGLVALAWSGITLLLLVRGWLRGITGWVWLLVLVLAGVGLLVQVQLAVGADSTQWQRFATMQAWGLLGMAWGVVFIAQFPVGGLVKRWELLVVNQRGHLRGWLNWFPMVFVVALLGLLGSSGGEGGVHGFQPAEFAKLVMALLLAMVMVTREDLRLNFAQTQDRLADYRVRYPWQSPTGWVTLRLFFWALLLVLLAGIVLGSVRDFSPVLILMLLAFGFAWAVRPSLPKLMRWLVVLSPVAILALLWLAWHNAGWFATVLERFQGDRLLVWVNPWSDPDSGLQAIRSLEAINGAGWFGQSWFGENGDLMKVPAVQNDFILAFVLGHTGAVAGLVLLVMQLCWVGLLFGLHQRLLAVRGNGRNGTLAVQLLAWLLYGLAWLQITHWLISWCNVLGLLPIMGQPMTWISSGNSHLLALGLPTLLLELLAVRYLQYKDAA